MFSEDENHSMSKPIHETDIYKEWRDATKEEQEYVTKYLKQKSKTTTKNFFELMEAE